MRSTDLRRRSDAAILMAVVSALTLPFLDKAFHVDDPYTLDAIGAVLADPLDPLGGLVSWVEVPRPRREFELNPPFLAYVLAPVVALAGRSEVALHAAMAAFSLLLALSALGLARRFTRSPQLAALLVATSPAVVVSANVMRDVPAAALSAAAVAATVAGTDRVRPALLLAGGVLAGLAALTKYSALALVPLVALYPILHGRARDALFVLVPVGLFALWCLHNLWMYGEPHVITISLGGLGPGRAWADNLWGLPVVVGSMSLLLPVWLLHVGRTQDGRALAVAATVALAAAWASERYLRGAGDAESLAWGALGSGLLAACGVEGLRDTVARSAGAGERRSRDAVFLLAWAGAPLLFSIGFVPFQAVRHVLPAVIPLTLLGVRALERGGGATRSHRAAVAATVGIQALLAFTLSVADYDHAEAYRRFARQAASRWQDDPGTTWSFGDWGWALYARDAGLARVGWRPPFPQVGDRVIQPVHVARPVPVTKLPGIGVRLRRVEEAVVHGRVPLRTIHGGAANFYAVLARRGGGTPLLPFRWLPGTPVERFEIYEVGRAPAPR